MKQVHGRIFRCVSVVISLMALTLLGTSASWAQQKSLKEQLVGSWTMVSADFIRKDGTKGNSFGDNPNGILIFDASGRFATVYGRPGRPHLSTIALSQIPAEELAAAARAFWATHGTWSVDEAGKTLSRKSELTLLPNNDKLESKASVAVSGNELKLLSAGAAGVTIEQTYRRAQ